MTQENSVEVYPVSDYKVKRGHGVEAKRVAERLKGFDYETSKVWDLLKTKFSSGITHNELKSIAQVCCYFSNLTLDRDATRDNRVLIKWFDENWNVLKDIINKISLRDEHGRPITKERETAELINKA